MLAAIADEDLAVIVKWWSDPEFARPASDDPVVPQRVDELKKWFMSDDRWKISFAIRLTDPDTLIGFLKVSVVSWPHRIGDVSLGIGDADHRGNGYGAEALRLGVDWAFRELNLHRLQLSVFSYNERAISLYRRLGFVHEGTSRESVRRDGRWYDSLQFGLLAGEWYESPQ